MRRLCGIALAAGLFLAMAPAARAQFSLTIGSPYPAGYGSAPVIGGYGYAPGIGGFAPGIGYGSYSGVATTSYYSSGYRGFAAPVSPYVGAIPYGGYRAPVYGYSSYGYAPYVAPGIGYSGYSSYGVYRRPGILGRVLLNALR